MQANETAVSSTPVVNKKSVSTLESQPDSTSETRYAEFWLRGIAALIEACVFMALSIPVCFILPFFISQVCEEPRKIAEHEPQKLSA